jgi:hypothetical protein
MVAPGVALEIATVCAELKAPAAGEKVGAAVTKVNVAADTALFEKPEATATASRVSVAETLMGPVHLVEFVVGVVPLVV